MKRYILSIVALSSCIVSGAMIQPSAAQESIAPSVETPTSLKAPPVVKITGSGAEQITVALLSLLSYSYYLTGEFEFSKQYAEQTIAQYKSLTNPYKNEGLKAQVDRAKIILSWIERWKKEPIVTEQQEIHFVLSEQALNAQRQLSIRTLRDVPVEITSSNPKVKVRFLSDDAGRKQDYYTERVAVVEVTAEAVAIGAEAILEISSPQIAKFKKYVPVSVKVPNQIRYPTLVSFGVVKTGDGDGEVRIMDLASPTPFRVLKIEFRVENKTMNDEGLQATFDTKQFLAKHQVELKYKPTGVSQNYSGKIRVLTDSPTQEIIEIPFIAQTQ